MPISDYRLVKTTLDTAQPTRFSRFCDSDRRVSAVPGDEDASRRDPAGNKHVEHGASDPRKIDGELRVARQLCQKPADMGDDEQFMLN